jgi:hypothetical protein
MPRAVALLALGPYPPLTIHTLFFKNFILLYNVDAYKHACTLTTNTHMQILPYKHLQM